MRKREVIYITCHLKEKESLNYEDVTSEWLKTAKPNSYSVKELTRYVHNGTSYKVDGKNVVLDYNVEEKEVAKWLSKTFGGEIYMCPRINNPSGIKTPDYLFKNQKFDLKMVKGHGKRTVDSIIKTAKEQSNNFVIDASKSKLGTKELVLQVRKIYNTAGREWVNVVILKKNSKLIGVYKKRS